MSPGVFLRILNGNKDIYKISSVFPETLEKCFAPAFSRRSLGLEDWCHSAHSRKPGAESCRGHVPFAAKSKLVFRNISHTRNQLINFYISCNCPGTPKPSGCLKASWILCFSTMFLFSVTCDFLGSMIGEK
jgi:hypothetical protein